MYQPPIVNFPVFSATWSESTNENGATTPAVLAAGGGGAGNTGVGNKIVSKVCVVCVGEGNCCRETIESNQQAGGSVGGVGFEHQCIGAFW